LVASVDGDPWASSSGLPQAPGILERFCQSGITRRYGAALESLELPKATFCDSTFLYLFEAS